MDFDGFYKKFMDFGGCRWILVDFEVRMSDAADIAVESYAPPRPPN